jgi:putative flippase GtrA
VAAWPEQTAPVLRGVALQYVRFAGVGALATSVHVTLFAVLLELLPISALVANLVAFGAAVLLSFAGHCRWTFRLRGGHGPALRRFSVVAVLGLGLNSAIAYGIVDRLGWHYAYAVVPIATITPVTLFLLSRRWAFRASTAQRRI